VAALAAGGSSTGTTTVTIPPETASGMWYVIGKADADGAVAETSENNNTYYASFQIGPDIVVSALTVPATAGAGQTVSLSETTRNQGGGQAAASVTRYYLSSNSTLDASDIEIGSRDVPVLAPGAESSQSASVTIPPGTSAGSWYIIVRTDADGAVTETNELNNTLARSIRIGS
jgi:subtilase family serine protease